MQCSKHQAVRVPAALQRIEQRGQGVELGRDTRAPRRKYAAQSCVSELRRCIPCIEAGLR